MSLRLITTLILSASLAPLQAAAAPPPARPNILHLHTDDHRADGLHALGNPTLHTPNLDRLVEQGMTFTRCYTMGSMGGAVCLPSRTMMLTGRSWLRIPGGASGPAAVGCFDVLAPGSFGSGLPDLSRRQERQRIQGGD